MNTPIIAFLLVCFAGPTNPVIVADYLIRNAEACDNVRRPYMQIYCRGEQRHGDRAVTNEEESWSTF